MSDRAIKAALFQESLRQLVMDTPAGERLPSEPALAQQLGVSRATLREAMRSYETQGLIRRQQGVGTFVVHTPPVLDSGLEVLESLEAIARQQGMNSTTADVEVIERLPDTEEQTALALGALDRVVEVSRVILVEGRSVAYLVDVLPADLLSVDLIKANFSGSILDLLLQHAPSDPAISRTDIQAVAAPPHVARLLGIQRGDVVLFFSALLLDNHSKPMDTSVSYFLPGTFRFHVVRRVIHQTSEPRR